MHTVIVGIICGIIGTMLGFTMSALMTASKINSIYEEIEIMKEEIENDSSR